MYKSITVSEKDVAVKRGHATFMLGAREYRSIYEEFWYVLSTVALMEGGMSSNKDHGIDDYEDEDSDLDSNNDDDDDEMMSEDGNPKKQKKSSLNNYK